MTDATAATLPTAAEMLSWQNPELKIENLDLLIKHMKNMPEEAFNMGQWAGPIMDEEDEVVTGAIFKDTLSDLSQFTKKQALKIMRNQEMQGAKGAPICGTSACIAGTVAFLGVAMAALDGRRKPGKGQDIEDFARNWLGMRAGQAQRLFMATGHPNPGPELQNVTRKQAIRTLQYFREKGLVTWQVPKGWKKTYVSTQKGKPLPFIIHESSAPVPVEA